MAIDPKLKTVSDKPLGARVRPLAALAAAAIALVLLLPAGGLQAASEYRIAPGDKLEISVVGVPELQRPATVEADGTISFPLIGTLKVAGQSLQEARTSIKSRLALKVYNRMAADGSEQPIVIGMDDITVAVVDYRPISVEGAVARPGQFAYRPSMTVREAVVLSGGYALTPGNVDNPKLASVDFRGEYEALWLDLVTQQTAISRLNAELDDRDLDRAAIAHQIPAYAPVSKETIAKIVAFAVDQFNIRREEFTRRKEFLNRSIEQMDSQIETVSAREKEYEQAVVVDREDLQRLEANLKNGTIVRSRVVEARRNLLRSETGRLEASAELTRLAQQRDALGQELTKMADEKKIRTLQELEAATVRLNEIRTKLQSVSEKLYMTSPAQTQIASVELPKPTITVHRNSAGNWTGQVVDESFELLPGDVVEITFGK